MDRPHRKTIIKCFLVVTFACLLFSKMAVLNGQNESSPAPSDKSVISQPDATGENTGTAKNVPAETPGQPSVLELANALGHNIVAINIVWTLVAGFLVFFMQAGFAFLETGFTRAKNVAHTMGMNIFIYGLGVFGWYVCGFALMYGGLGPLTTLGGFAGLNHEFAINILGKSFGLFGGRGFFLTGAYDVGVFTLFLFEVVFMDTAATIPTGAMAERWKWASFVVYGFLVGSIIYPLFGNWVWGGGWLSQLGVNFGLGHGHVDFAGSSVVHMTGGMIGLVGAWMLGPRIGKYNPDGTVNAIPGHNIPMAVLGTLILAFGWFGFNPGSTLAGTDLRIGVIATNTMLSSVMGMLAATFWIWGVRADKPDPSMMCNGLVAGLVAITAPCAFVNSQGAVIIGIVAGILVVESVLFIDKRLKVDDPVGAISAHAVAGAWGCLGLGLFADGTYGAGWNGVSGTVTGLLYGNPGQFAAECTGVLTNFIYVGAIAFVIFKLIDIFVGNRVDAETEIDGLDIGQMGVSGYERLSADERGFP